MSRINTSISFTLAAAFSALAGGCYISVDKSTADSPCAPGDPVCASAGGPPAPPDVPGVPGPGDPGYTGGPDGTPGSGGVPGGSGGAGGQTTGPNAPLPRAPAPPATCPAATVSRFRELMIVDPGVTRDTRADDRSPHRPWSFRQRIEALVPGNAEAAGPLVDAWLAQWSSLTEVPVSTTPGAARIPIDPRPAAHEVLRCPWLKLSPDNACDTDCGSCRGHRADLARSPFKLLAIVNRADLAGAGDAAACGADGGQLRFVYGAADPATLRTLPFTIIFEYDVALAAGETLRDWASAWHELGALSPGTSAFGARLDDVVARGLARATLTRVLTNEVAFGAADGLPWEMRQFVPALTDAGTVRLVEVAVSGTPRLTLAPSPELGRWIDDNAASVLAGDNPLSVPLLAASAPIPTVDFGWRTTARDAAVGAAFNRNTCNGCHGGRTDPADVPFQHVAPPVDLYYGTGGTGSTATARLSRFLHDPGRDDELARRERQLAAVLCARCPAY